MAVVQIATVPYGSWESVWPFALSPSFSSLVFGPSLAGFGAWCC